MRDSRAPDSLGGETETPGAESRLAQASGRGGGTRTPSTGFGDRPLTY